MGLTVCIGDKETSKEMAQILVTVPHWLANMTSGRVPIDLSGLKMFIFDEADEIFSQEENHKHLKKIYQKLHSINIIP